MQYPYSSYFASHYIFKMSPVGTIVGSELGKGI